MQNTPNQPTDEIMKYSTARAVATRKNNELKKAFPLFFDQIEQLTPEQVIDRKKRYVEFSEQRREQRQKEELIEIAAAREELKELVSDENEFLFLEETVIERQNRYGGLKNSYSIMAKHLRKRLEPCSKLALGLLLYLELNKGKELTPNELSKVFNVHRNLISEQLEWLYDCELVDTSVNGLTPCSITGYDCVHWLARY